MNEHVVLVEGVWNFRDAGGYKTVDGRTIKKGKILRSGELSQLTDEGMKIIEQLGVKYIFDYRTLQEYESAPDRKVAGIKHRLVPALKIDPGKNDAFLIHEHIKEKGTLKHFKGENNPLLHHYQNESFYINNEAYHALMTFLRSEEDAPFIQHCTAGKDRTGFGIALVLLTLGVDKETVMEDYLLTNVCRKDFTEKKLKEEGADLLDEESIEVLRSMMEVRRDYLEATLKGIEDRFGDFRTYIFEEYNITDEMLKHIKGKYLE